MATGGLPVKDEHDEDSWALTQEHVLMLRDPTLNSLSVDVDPKDGKVGASLHLMEKRRWGDGYSHTHVNLPLHYYSAPCPVTGRQWGTHVGYTEREAVWSLGKLAKAGDFLQVHATATTPRGVETGYCLYTVELSLVRKRGSKEDRVASFIAKTEVRAIPQHVLEAWAREDATQEAATP